MLALLPKNRDLFKKAPVFVEAKVQTFGSGTKPRFNLTFVTICNKKQRHLRRPKCLSHKILAYCTIKTALTGLKPGSKPKPIL